jgi:hypothetical protein
LLLPNPLRRSLYRRLTNTQNRRQMRLPYKAVIDKLRVIRLPCRFAKVEPFAFKRHNATLMFFWCFAVKTNLSISVNRFTLTKAIAKRNILKSL